MIFVLRRLNSIEHNLGDEIHANGSNSLRAALLMNERTAILRTLRDLNIVVHWNSKKGYYV